MDFQEMFFSFDGRLNRKPYILRFYCVMPSSGVWAI